MEKENFKLAFLVLSSSFFPTLASYDPWNLIYMTMCLDFIISTHNYITKHAIVIVSLPKWVDDKQSCADSKPEVPAWVKIIDSHKFVASKVTDIDTMSTCPCLSHL